MKLTKAAIKWFEEEQRTYGTEVALYNFVFTMLHSVAKLTLGAKRLRID